MSDVKGRLFNRRVVPGLAFLCAALIAVVFVGRTTNANARGDVLGSCATQAVSAGFQRGQCAYYYINACVTTQSREEMSRWTRTAGLGAGHCPEAPNAYSEAFNSALRAASKL